jgi:hypothetical protein
MVLFARMDVVAGEGMGTDAIDGFPFAHNLAARPFRGTTRSAMKGMETG